MRDHIITKPLTLQAYAMHRMVAELCSGSTYQFVDRGDYFVVRTSKEITSSGKALVLPLSGAVIAFELRASVAARHKNTNLYPDTNDWRFRRAWLEKYGARYGFDILALNVTSKHLKIKNKDERTFSIDSTDFTGVLKVTDANQFKDALHKGIGRVGKAFGMGMLVV